MKLMSIHLYAFCLLSLSTTCYAGHYKFHPEEYRAAVTELLKKASVLYMSRRQLNGYDVGTSEHSDTPPSTSNLPRTDASSVGRLRRAPIDPTDQFFLPSSMEYNESSEGSQPNLFNVPKECRWLGPQALCVDEWEARHIHTVAHRHDSFNPMKCVRCSRL